MQYPFGKTQKQKPNSVKTVAKGHNAVLEAHISAATGNSKCHLNFTGSLWAQALARRVERKGLKSRGSQRAENSLEQQTTSVLLF